MTGMVPSMTRKENTKRKPDGSLDIKEIVSQFDSNESLPSHRKGTFKIDVPFERALEKIVKATPQKEHSKHKSNAERR